jgi:anti-sigma regulatory factor (Ser/Thr protein kinase)
MQADPSNVELEVCLPNQVEAAGLARRVLDRLRPYVGCCYEDARLLVSEAVTNAVLHGAADGSVRLWVKAKRDELEVRVTNSSGSKRPVMRTPQPDVGGGLGLLLVDRIAPEWGLEYNDHVLVWFTLR